VTIENSADRFKHLFERVGLCSLVVLGLETVRPADSLLFYTITVRKICANELVLTTRCDTKSNIRAIEHKFDTFRSCRDEWSLPLSIHDLSIPDLSRLPRSRSRDSRWLPARRSIEQAPWPDRGATSANWQLTDRGIAVVMVIVALIMAAASRGDRSHRARVTSGDTAPAPSEQCRPSAESV
jgi:hypothetical protein